MSENYDLSGTYRRAGCHTAPIAQPSLDINVDACVRGGARFYMSDMHTPSLLALFPPNSLPTVEHQRSPVSDKRDYISRDTVPPYIDMVKGVLYPKL